MRGTLQQVVGISTAFALMVVAPLPSLMASSETATEEAMGIAHPIRNAEGQLGWRLESTPRSIAGASMDAPTTIRCQALVTPLGRSCQTGGTRSMSGVPNFGIDLASVTSGQITVRVATSGGYADRTCTFSPLMDVGIPTVTYACRSSLRGSFAAGQFFTLTGEGRKPDTALGGHPENNVHNSNVVGQFSVWAEV